MEVPGEDPMINGQYGAAYSLGLQNGADGRYLRAITTLKHWDAYSLETSDGYTRYNFNVRIRESRACAAVSITMSEKREHYFVLPLSLQCGADVPVPTPGQRFKLHVGRYVFPGFQSCGNCWGG